MGSAEQIEQQDTAEPVETSAEKRVRRRWWRQLGLALLAVVLLVLVIGVINRDIIAKQQIDEQLRDIGLEATYDVERIGPKTQILKNIKIGDPARPDVTVERAVVILKANLTGSFIDRVILTKPRVYGSYYDGKLSFGALDPLLFSDSEEPFELPDFVLKVDDGRGLVQTDFGDVGLSFDSDGHLRSGFTASLAASSPNLAIANCNGNALALTGVLSINAERPRFVGPLRLDNAGCDNGLSASKLAFLIDAEADRQLMGVDGKVVTETGQIRFQDFGVERLVGETQASFKDGLLVAQYDLTGEKFASSMAGLSQVTLDGELRAMDSFARIESRAKINGSNLRVGSGLDNQLAGLATSADGTLIAPLIGKLRGGLRAALPGSELAADVLFRQNAEESSILLPQVRLTARGGARIVDASRVQIAIKPNSAPLIGGNFLVSAQSLPSMAGDFQVLGDRTALNFAMNEYRANGSALALPAMKMEMSSDGTISFVGELRATGPIPDGNIEALRAPFSGRYAANGALTLWNECADLTFKQLTYSGAKLSNRSVRLCPNAGQPVFRSDANGIQFAATIPNANIQGSYQSDPFAVTSAALAVAFNSQTNKFAARAPRARIAGRYGSDRFDVSSSSLAIDYDLNSGELIARAPQAKIAGRYGSQDFVLDTPNLNLAFPGVLSIPNASVTIGRGSSAPRISWASLQGAIGVSSKAAIRDVQVEIGTGPSATRMAFEAVDATMSDVISGTFEQGDVTIGPVPMDIFDARGSFTFANGILNVFDGEFRLEDRDEVDRFKPLIGRGAVMAWDGDVIDADAALFSLSSGTQVLSSSITHTLSTGLGGADLIVDGLRFDPSLQPDDLTELALGIVANVDGVLSGTGRIDWTPEGEVTSSGRFATKDLDLAAPFGPTKGLSGEIVFTDLLNLTTLPDQTLTVQSINPGIEVFDGLINYQMKNGQLLAIKEGEWPFLGGTLTLEKSDFGFSREENREFNLVIKGAEAALFIQQMELANISATGTFDGRLPLVFEGVEGRIVGGKLTARPPGGNLSYVGELSYQDMGVITNYAFASLRSLDFQEMTIGIDGPLTGDLVTAVKFDGISQGEGAKRNFITKQVAKLPIQFNVNITAPFYKLITSLRSMYDPAFVRDPRDVGLISKSNRLPPRDTESLQQTVESLDDTPSE